MKKIIGLLLSVVMLTDILAGCAGTPADNSGTSTPENSPAVTYTSSTEESTYPRTYTDSRGKEIVFETQPTKVISTDWSITESLFIMDYPPVASSLVEMMSGWESMKSYFEAYHVEELGGGMSTVNLEKMIELQPDLILTTAYTKEDVIEQYEKIAPVAVLSREAFVEREMGIREIGKIIGIEQTVNEILGKEKEQLVQYKEQLSEQLGDKTVMFLSESGKVISFYYGNVALHYDTEKGLGLHAPKSLPTEVKTENITLEGLSEYNPDVIVISSSEEYLKELEKNSV
ncbi:MAG TPA: hypothetical protein DEP23_12365 [Ruminococcaceae bacterium]|jgi:iron complex transport system substrate-binding protein|nr:hypothetical protein [Oscillospiraceae bacterium]